MYGGNFMNGSQTPEMNCFDPKPGSGFCQNQWYGANQPLNLSPPWSQPYNSSSSQNCIMGQAQHIPGGVTFTFPSSNQMQSVPQQVANMISPNPQPCPPPTTQCGWQLLPIEHQIALKQLEKQALELMLLQEQCKKNPFSLQFHYDAETSTCDLPTKGTLKEPCFKNGSRNCNQDVCCPCDRKPSGKNFKLNTSQRLRIGKQSSTAVDMATFMEEYDAETLNKASSSIIKEVTDRNTKYNKLTTYPRLHENDCEKQAKCTPKPSKDRFPECKSETQDTLYSSGDSSETTSEDSQKSDTCSKCGGSKTKDPKKKPKKNRKWFKGKGKKAKSARTSYGETDSEEEIFIV